MKHICILESGCWLKGILILKLFLTCMSLRLMLNTHTHTHTKMWKRNYFEEYGSYWVWPI